MSEPTTDPTPEPTEPTAAQGEPADEQLGENGKKALTAERNRATAAEKAAAALQKRLDELEAANLSELEKAQKAAADAQEAAAKAGTEALRYRIAAETGITDNADLILTASDEETMRKQAELWATRTPTSPRPDPSQGAKGAGSKGTPADSFAEFFQSNI